jgi:hypothetical protein
LATAYRGLLDHAAAADNTTATSSKNFFLRLVLKMWGMQHEWQTDFAGEWSFLRAE